MSVRRLSAAGVPISAPENISQVAGSFFAVPFVAAAGCRDDFVVGWANWQAPFLAHHELYLSDDDGNGIAEQCGYCP